MRNIKNCIPRFCKLLTVGVALLMCGCAAPAKVEPTPAPVLSATPQPDTQPVQGGELTLPMAYNAFRNASGEIADPLQVYTEEALNLYSLVLEPLVRCDMNGRLTPSLAERWECDSTGKIWTLSLRQNVLWHGTTKAFMADDVLYTVEKLQTLGKETYYSDANAVIEDVEKVDETTIRVTMKEAGSSALYALNFPILYSDASENQLIGTGPYKIQSSTDEEITLTINTNWWKQEPYIERIRCLVRDSNEVAIASYNAGQLSMVPTSNVFVGRYREDGVTEVLDVMTQTAEILLFNQRNTVLKDVNVRKAIAYALDRNSVVTNVYMHHASVCDVPIAPDSFLYDPTSKVYDYNLTMAQTLLAKAGWEDVDSDGILENINQPAYELKLKLLVNETAENTLRKSAATLIASQLSQIGIMVEVETEAFSLGDTSSRYQRRLQEGNFDLAMVGFNVRQSGDLREYLLSDGSQNYAGYSNDRMDQYLQQAVNAVDEKSMVETQSQLQQEIVDTLPFMTLYFRMNSIVYDSSIKNVSEIREPDVLRTVSKWYIQQQ